MINRRTTVLFFIAVMMMMSIVSCGVRETGSSSEPEVQGGKYQSGAAGAQDPESAQGQQLAWIRDEGNVQTAIYPAQASYLGEQRWGYIDHSGKFVLQPKYTRAMRFQTNGLAVAGKGGKAGLIDRAGKFIVEPVYSDIGDFSEGLAVAQDDKGFEVLDSQGNVISDKYPYIGNYRNGRAVYYTQSQGGRLRYGYLGETGQSVIEPVYEYAGEFNGGLAVVKQPNGGYLLIDRSGKKLKSFEYSYVADISDGMMAFSPDQNGKYGYLNSKGEVAIAPSFLTAQSFSDGLAVVNASEDYAVNKYGLIDKKGKYLINPQYNNILQLGEDMVALGPAIDPNNIFAGSKYALATKDGVILTDFIFYGLEPFQNGVASVYDNTMTFFINKEGKRVEDLPAAEGIGNMELLDSLVYADIDQRPYYMNKQGETVYRPSSMITLKSGIKVSEEKFRPNRNYLVYYPVLSNLDSLKVEESINERLRDTWTDVKIKPTDDLDYSYEGSFNIGFNRKDLLELQKSAYDFPFGAAHGMPIMQYVHVNTKVGSFYQLEDLFKDGSNYTKVLSAIIGQQIKKNGEEMGVWQDSYKGIKPDQPFYLTGDTLMLYFEPYEIAPYAAGFPTFPVPFTEISNIIDKKGSFWLSFN